MNKSKFTDISDMFETPEEENNFIYNRYPYECHCCHKNIESDCSVEQKKKILEEKLTTLRRYVCDKCENDLDCKYVNWIPHPHTRKGKEVVKKIHEEGLELRIDIKALHEVCKKIGFPSFEEWLKTNE